MVKEKNQTFVCETCSKDFKRRDSLKRHILSHCNDYTKEFICDKCNKCFRRKDSLARHIQSHSKVNIKYICIDCNKIYGSKYSLERHKVDHHEPYRFICDICDKKMKRRDDLIRHIRNHDNVYPFTCNICNRRFKWKNCLARHSKSCPAKNRAESIRKCADCNENFQNKTEFAKHAEKIHGVQLRCEYLQFASIVEFEEWKNSRCWYFKEGSWKTSDGLVTRFRCHRSGIYEDSCKKNNTDRKRNLKACGSKKLGGFCPSEITLKQRQDDESCLVTYQKIHMGHDLPDEKEKCFIRENKVEENDVEEMKIEMIVTTPDCIKYCDEYLCEKIENKHLQPLMLNKLDELHRCHRKAVEYSEKQSFTIVSIDDCHWQIASFEDPEDGVQEMYFIEKIETKECDFYDEPCGLTCTFCKSCFHEYVCSCLDCAINNNMCEHIHALLFSQRNQEAANFNTPVEPYASPVVPTDIPKDQVKSSSSATKRSQLIGNLESHKNKIRCEVEKALSHITPDFGERNCRLFYKRNISNLVKIVNTLKSTALIKNSRARGHQRGRITPKQKFCFIKKKISSKIHIFLLKRNFFTTLLQCNLFQVGVMIFGADSKKRAGTVTFTPVSSPCIQPDRSSLNSNRQICL